VALPSADHGSACFPAYQHRLNRIVNRSGSIIGPSGSLAPLWFQGVASFRATYLETVSERRQVFQLRKLNATPRSEIRDTFSPFVAF